MTLAGSIWVLVLACGAEGLWADELRFKDQPIVWKVDDARDILEPKELDFKKSLYYARVFGTRWLTRKLELRRKTLAQNTNALDEVPDSTWFTNRVGKAVLAAEGLARGPHVTRPPRVPLMIVQGKITGVSSGFFARDATGRLFLMKFGAPEVAAAELATGVIVNRLFWAMGFHVPSDSIFTFRKGDLRLSPKAKIENEMKVQRRLTWDDIEEILSAVPRQPDGRYRVLASEFLPGKPKGGFPLEGRRKDDPNDVVDHEHRRELRGLKVFAAWVSHTDMKRDNTLDMYVEEDDRHFLRHYLLDFGLALGVHRLHPKGQYAYGWEHAWDWNYATLGFFSLGLWKRPWEEEVRPPWPSVGPFSAEGFDPRQWKGAFPYWPFSEVHPTDEFWAAKIVMAFDRSMIQAAVAEGKVEPPEAAEFLVETLMKRKEIIGRTYLDVVTPLDRFTIQRTSLCAVDLSVFYGLAEEGMVERLSRADETTEEIPVGPEGSVCLPISPAAGYRIDRLRIRRGDEVTPVMQVHYITGKQPRILGLVRVER